MMGLEPTKDPKTVKKTITGKKRKAVDEKINELKNLETDAARKRELARCKIVKSIKLNLTIGVETTREWMKRLGFLYSDVHKHFYVDNH